MKKAKTTLLCACAVVVLGACGPARAAAPVQGRDVEQKARSYFAGVFACLQDAANKHPSTMTFRALMQPAVMSVKGVYSAYLLDASWTVRQTLFPWHYYAVGTDRRNERGLEHFRWELADDPGPQVSDILPGSLLRPALIEVRYPVAQNARISAIISLYLRAGEFLRATGIDRASAYEIICRGAPLLRRGRLSGGAVTETFDLAATEWTVRYDP